MGFSWTSLTFSASFFLPQQQMEVVHKQVKSMKIKENSNTNEQNESYT